MLAPNLYNTDLPIRKWMLESISRCKHFSAARAHLKPERVKPPRAFEYLFESLNMDTPSQGNRSAFKIANTYLKRVEVHTPVTPGHFFSSDHRSRKRNNESSPENKIVQVIVRNGSIADGRIRSGACLPMIDREKVKACYCRRK